LHLHDSIKGSSLDSHLFYCRLPAYLPVFSPDALSPAKFDQDNCMNMAQIRMIVMFNGEKLDWPL
jgi:hypothetical protein